MKLRFLGGLVLAHMVGCAEDPGKVAVVVDHESHASPAERRSAIGKSLYKSRAAREAGDCNRSLEHLSTIESARAAWNLDLDPQSESAYRYELRSCASVVEQHLLQSAAESPLGAKIRLEARAKSFPIRELRERDRALLSRIVAIGQARCLSIGATPQANGPYVARAVHQYCESFGASGPVQLPLPHAASTFAVTGSVDGVDHASARALRTRLMAAFARTSWYDASSLATATGRLSGYAAREVVSSQLQVERPRIPLLMRRTDRMVEERTAKYSFGSRVSLEGPTGPYEVAYTGDEHIERVRSPGETFVREPIFTPVAIAFADQVESIVANFVADLNAHYNDRFCAAERYTTEEAARCALGTRVAIPAAAGSALASVFGTDAESLYRVSPP